MTTSENNSAKEALRVYKASGGKREIAAETAFYSVSGIQHLIRKSQIATNPAGRPPVRPSTRSAATRMRLEGLKVEYITQMLAGISPASLWRMFGHMKRRETAMHAVGTILVHPQTEQILIHKEIYPQDIFHKYEGEHSIELTWRSKSESTEAAVQRLIEREVFGKISLKKIGFEKLFVKFSGEPIINVVVADVAVSLYVLTLTEFALQQELTSDKVADIHWEDPLGVVNNPDINFRTGAREMVEFYNYYKNNRVAKPGEYLFSDLNQRFLATV